MRNFLLICMLTFGLVLSWSIVIAEEGFYVIPVKKNNYAPVPKTGQTASYGTGDDGDLQMGVSWPDPRFSDNGDGTVTDKLTGLIWLKNANCPNGEKLWSDALTFANSLYDGWTGDGSGGDCGLSDGSSAGAWRLPNVRELYSLIYYMDVHVSGPAVPNTAGTGKWTEGDIFNGLQHGPGSYYWSSTTYTYTYDAGVTAFAVYMEQGLVARGSKSNGHFVWPVRGGND